MTTCHPWLESVDLHPDVLSKELSEDVFMLDLGVLADYPRSGDQTGCA